ncbi:anthrax toxin-like adenylyl cyclase domain-containing protein [Glaciimonas sp. GNP009]
MNSIPDFNASSITPNSMSKASLVASKKNSIEKSIKDVIDHVSSQTGIVTAHLAPLQKLAQDYNCIIGFRPVDPLATELIENGHPTKRFCDKGKSASWGPQAGMICVNQRYSKLENASEEKIAKFNKYAQSSIQNGDVIAIPLSISPKRLNSLLKLGVITNLSLENAQGIVTFSAKAPSNHVFQCEASRQIQNDQDRYVITFQGAPIEVLAPKIDQQSPMEARALTADYDLFLIGPHLGDVGAQDNLPVPDIAPIVLRNKVDAYQRMHSKEMVGPYNLNAELVEAYGSENKFSEKEDKNIGNATQRIRDMIPVINHALVGDGEKVVHHSADSGSPATDPSSNYPATFFLPIKIGPFEVMSIINNSQELATLVQEAKDGGYHMPLNPLWEKEVSEVRRSSYQEALTTLDT